jgi:prophage tail gpP-like protein
VSEANLELKVNGVNYGGWQTIEVKRSIEELAGSFRLGYFDHWIEGGQALPIEEGDECEITIDGTQVLAGYVDEFHGDYDLDTHTLSVEGRSFAGDLCDSSAIFKSGQWRQTTLKQVALDLCAPFDIGVMTGGDGNLVKFGIQQGESVFEVLERAARSQGVLLTSSANGSISFVQPGAKTTSTRIELGVNVKRSSLRGSWKERFGSYLVKGQSPGAADFFGVAAAQPAPGKATDDDVDRYRPLIVMPETHARSDLQKRAVWERNIRAGRSRRYRYQVPGWSRAEGLWEPNLMVHVADDFWGLDDDLLVASVTLRRDDDGSTAELELASKEAFQTVPLPTQRHRNGRHGHGQAGKRTW